ncbi:hypothetical protein BS17DRAFT_697841, partial [Gyrodon lividus]
QIYFGEALYYTCLAIEADLLNRNEADPDSNWHFADIVLVKLFSVPDQQLLDLSHNTLPSCQALQETRLIQIKDILSVVAMIPHMPCLPSGVTQECFFTMEKPGLDVSHFGIRGEREDGDDDDKNAELK